MCTILKRWLHCIRNCAKINTHNIVYWVNKQSSDDNEREIICQHIYILLYMLLMYTSDLHVMSTWVRYIQVMKPNLKKIMSYYVIFVAVELSMISISLRSNGSLSRTVVVGFL